MSDHPLPSSRSSLTRLPMEFDIEHVARRLCVAMGIDPDRRVRAMGWASMTRYERSNSPPPYYDYEQPMAAWQMMAREAEFLIASRIVNRELDYASEQFS